MGNADEPALGRRHDGGPEVSLREPLDELPGVRVRPDGARAALHHALRRSAGSALSSALRRTFRGRSGAPSPPGRSPIAHRFVLLSSKPPQGSSESVACLDHTRPTNDSPDSTGSGGPIPVPLAQVFGDRLAAAVSFATTEHFNLQTARAATVSEANGRAIIYLAALSSNLIALALIGQMSRLGTAFHTSALILLPVLSFVGAVTFLRLVQNSIEDIAYAHRIALLRSFYLRLSPELEPYILVVRGTRSAAPFSGERLAPSAWQLTLTTAGMIAVV